MDVATTATKVSEKVASENVLSEIDESQTEIESKQPLYALAVSITAAIVLASVVSGTSNASLSTAESSKAGRLSQVASINTAHILSQEQLKLNALANLHRSPSIEQASNGRENILRYEIAQPTFNKNVFLLASRMSNESKLAELQMQPFNSDITFNRFTANNESDAKRKSGQFDGVGFPHIETNNRSDENRYKPYRQLVSISSNSDRRIVPHVKCMGLSPERVAKRAEKYEPLILELAVKHSVSASLVKAVISKESCFNIAARSPVGAIGLMQLMPETARWLKVKNPDNPEQNLAAGVRYLAQLKKRFGTNELALAAYNAGPGNVDRYKGVPPFAETQNYVRDVMHFYRGYVATTRYVNAQYDY